MDQAFILTNRVTRNLLKLVAEVLNAAIAHHIGYFAEGHFIVADKLFNALYLYEDNVFLERSTCFFWKHLTQVCIRMPQLIAQEIWIPYSWIGIISVKEKLYHRGLYLLHELWIFVIYKSKTTSFQDSIDPILIDKLCIKVNLRPS